LFSLLQKEDYLGKKILSQDTLLFYSKCTLSL